MTASSKPGTPDALLDEAARVLGVLGLPNLEHLTPWIAMHAEQQMGGAARSADNTRISVPLVFSLSLRGGDPEYIYLLMAHGPEPDVWRREEESTLERRVWLKAKPCTPKALDTIRWATEDTEGWRKGPELMGWIAHQPWNHRFAIHVVGMYAGR